MDSNMEFIRTFCLCCVCLSSVHLFLIVKGCELQTSCGKCTNTLKVSELRYAFTVNNTHLCAQTPQLARFGGSCLSQV